MKRFQSIGVLLSAITGVLVVLLASVFTYSAKEAYDRREAAVQLLKTVDVLSDVFAAQEALRFEQGEISTALALKEPIDGHTRVKIEKLHARSEVTLRKTHQDSNLESDGSVPNLAKIRAAWGLYETRYGEAMTALGRPLDQRSDAIRANWPAAMNGLVTMINLRTRVRSMYIADASALNNEMTKIIRMAWSMREIVGRDRQLIAQAIVSGKQLTSDQLQQFAEQEGNLNYPWTVLASDRTDLPTFPAALAKDVDNVAKVYFGHVRLVRRSILHALEYGQPAPLSALNWLEESDRSLIAITDVSRGAFQLTR